MTFYSQSGEDRALFDHYFRDPLVCDGTFVELGALDGIRFSNTKFYEDGLRWSGVLIEAEPQNAAKLITNRLYTKNYATAVCSEEQKEVKFIGSGAVGGIADEMSQGHKDKWIKGKRLKQEITVPCMTMAAILKEAGVTRIDLFSLDVEGAELSVLQTMDWSIPVRVFLIERSQNHAAVVDLLREHGYQETTWDISDYCKPGHSCTNNAVFESKQAWPT